jgi:hypothetical protein
LNINDYGKWRESKKTRDTENPSYFTIIDILGKSIKTIPRSETILIEASTKIKESKINCGSCVSKFSCKEIEILYQDRLQKVKFDVQDENTSYIYIIKAK